MEISIPKKIELGKLNIVIGVVLITNLYLLGGITKIPNAFSILFCLGVSIYGFLKSFQINLFFSLLNNWIVSIYLSLSVIFGFIDFFIHETSPDFNDMIRVSLYAIYFSWTCFIFNDKFSFNYWLNKVGIWSVWVLIIEGFIELFFPFVWALFLSSNVEKRNFGRIGGTLIDSNMFACTLLLLVIILYYEVFNKNNKKHNRAAIIIALPTLYLIEISGSRQAILALVVFFIALALPKMNFRKLFNFLILLLGFVVIFVLALDPIKNYAADNPSSAISRVLGGEQSIQSAQSNLDRKNSLLQGLSMISDNYFLYGPGLFNFASRWQKDSVYYVPHNGLIYLMAQFGVFSLLVFYLFYCSFLKSWSIKRVAIFMVVVIHLFFQPNAMYYAITFLGLFYIDVKKIYLNT